MYTFTLALENYDSIFLPNHTKLGLMTGLLSRILFGTAVNEDVGLRDRYKQLASRFYSKVQTYCLT